MLNKNKFISVNKKILFIFELANNHNGSIDNALKLIDQASTITNHTNIDFAFKLQFRDLETFLHKDCEKMNNKHVKRFIETKLTKDEYKKICKKIKDQKFKLVITPFDEPSVDFAIDCDVDILKIASCSNTDWPLIEKVSKQNIPVIASTGGIGIDKIDNLSSYFNHQKVPLSILHCVSVYPTIDPKRFNMNFIKKMNRRYPENLIGYSGHEEEDDFLPSLSAVSNGAKILERHYSNLEERNKYSISKNKLNELLNQINRLIDVLGSEDKILQEDEINSINMLQRGVYAKEKIKVGGNIDIKNQTYLAFPKKDINQLSPEDFSKNINILSDINRDNAVHANTDEKKKYLIRKYVHRYKYFLNEAGIYPGEDSQAELSHHFGIDKIEEFGAFIVTIVNGIYCKKIISLFPGQYHPRHKHHKKIETFHILYGDLSLIKDGITYKLKVGDKIDVLNNEWHEFNSENGCVFEEISTESLRKDSNYFDEKIQKQDIVDRKTFVTLY